MKQPVIIKTSKDVYKFKLKYSTLCDLKGLGVDLLTEKGSKELQEDATKLRLVFWKGLETGEMRKFTEKEAFDIFDDVMEDLGPEEFGKMIPEALAIKTSAPVKN